MVWFVKMIATISTIIGLFSGIIPGVIKYFERREDKKHELELQRLRNEIAARTPESTRHVKEIEELKAIVEDLKSARSFDDYTSGDSSFMGKLRSSVRPIITYTFFGLFFSVKFGLGLYMLLNGINPQVILNTILDETTMSIFGAIMAFWFGSRPLDKYYKQKDRTKNG